MNTRTNEQRWDERVPVDIPVQLIGPARAILAGRLINFSVSGGFVEINLHVPIMTNLTLMLQGGRGVPTRPRAIAGYVVRHMQGGMGVAWWKLTPVTTAHVVYFHDVLRAAAGPLQFPEATAACHP